MAIPPRFMSELRDRLTLSDIIGRKVKLVRAGREFKGCCPFHKEKSPSFYVNDDKQFYHCFGCGAHGDAIGFVTQHDNLSFIEAVEMLAAQAGMQVPQQAPQDIERARQDKDIYSLMDAAASFFADALGKPEQRTAKQYLLERGMAAELMNAFRIGFAPPDGQALRKFLKTQNYTDAQMIDAGLVRRSDKGGEPYSFFRDRIMFPVADRRGRVVAFGGRILPEHLRPPDNSDRKPPKYINSAETALFHKGRMLYGESHARAAAGAGDKVVVVEGYMDVLACFQAGFRGAVAPLGTALTDEQILSLWKMIPAAAKAPILCFDGDDAGRRAAARACENLMPLLKPDHTAVIAFLPQGQDPDSLLRGQGKPALDAILNAALPLDEFLWNKHTAGKRFDTPEARAGLTKTLDEETARITDRTVQHYYRQGFRDRIYKLFGPSSAGKNTMTRGGQSRVQNKSFKPGRAGGGRVMPGMLVPRPVAAGFGIAHGILLAAILNHPALFDAVEEDLGGLRLEDGGLDALRQAILNRLGQDSALDPDTLRNYLIGQGFEDELDLVLSEAIYGRAPFVRVEGDLAQALSGWQETWRFMHEQSLVRERQAAAQALIHDFSEENERKILNQPELHDISKASGE